MYPRGGIRFIDHNPVTRAYMEGQRFANEQERHDLAADASAQQLAENKLAAPTRLRSLNAGADMSESQARVQVGTEGNQIERSDIGVLNDRVNYGRNQINLDIEGATKNDKVAQSRLQTQQQVIANDQASQNLTQDSQLFPGELEGQRIGNQNATIAGQQATQNLEQDAALFPGVVQQQEQQLEQGAIANDQASLNLEKARAAKEEEFLRQARENPQTAIMWARANGLEITPEMEALVMDRNLVAMAAGIADRLADQYPGDENLLIRDKEFDRIMGNVMRDPTPSMSEAEQMIVQSNETPNIPTPKSSTGRASVFEQKRGAWLALYPGDQQGALDYASGLKRTTPQENWTIAVKAAQEQLKYDFNYAALPSDKQAEQVQAVARALYGVLSDVPSLTAGPTPPPPGPVNPPPAAAPAPAPAPGAQAAPPPAQATPAAAAPAPQQAPQQAPQTPPILQGRQLQWSPSLQRFRDKATGEMFDAQGNRVQ
jgi:hypothetical protein